MLHAFVSLLLFLVWTAVVLSLAPDAHRVMAGGVEPDPTDRIVLAICAPTFILVGFFAFGFEAGCGASREMYRVVILGKAITDE